MSPTDLAFLSIGEAARDGTSAVQLTAAVLSRIEELDPVLHAYVTVSKDVASQRARDLDTGGRRAGSLWGIPVGFKDNIATADMRTTANSRVLETWRPTKDAAVVANLKRAGAVVIGKHNLNEFGWSLPSPDDLTPAPRNPWNTGSAAIGSSSGSAVAVAAGLCFGALGTDSGGSVRLPAANCGVVGLKPSHGALPLEGAFGVPTLSDVGPIARSVNDVRLLLAAAAGAAQPGPQPQRSGEGLGSIRVGVLPSLATTIEVDPDIQRAYSEAVRELERLGARIVELSGVESAAATAAVRVILNAEAYAEHASSLRSHPERYGESARVHLTQGAFLQAADYIYALRFLARYAAKVDSLFDSVDCLVTPTAPYLTAEEARQPETHRAGLGDMFTSPFNLSGNPAVSVPAGFSSSRMPIGIQMVGRMQEDERLLWIAEQYEQSTPWHTQHPIN